MVVVNNIELNTSAYDILMDIRSQLVNGKLKDIRKNGSTDLQITCPHHSNGQEKTPSCFVRLEDGVCHCFGCQWSAPFEGLVAECFGWSRDKAAKWLLETYSDGQEQRIKLDSIVLKKGEETNKIIDESILNGFESYHPYFKKRGISDEIIERFELKYEPSTECVVFPVRDEKKRLVGLTKRKVYFKRYELPKFKNKPVYLLYYILEKKINHVVVVEGQVDALVSWSRGVPAIALFGAATSNYQLELLNKSGIKDFILMYDNDEAGRKGAKRFKDNIKNSFITDIIMPDGVDVASCTKEQFYKLLSDNDTKYIIPDSQIK